MSINGTGRKIGRWIIDNLALLIIAGMFSAFWMDYASDMRAIKRQDTKREGQIDTLQIVTYNFAKELQNQRKDIEKVENRMNDKFDSYDSQIMDLWKSVRRSGYPSLSKYEKMPDKIDDI